MTKWLTNGEVCQHFNVTASTLRTWDKQGRIKTQRTVGNQRRYSSLLLEEPQVGGENSPSESNSVIYCRVSSSKQKDDLVRQVASMQEKHLGCVLIKDVASGLNYKRKVLKSLLERAGNKTIHVCYSNKCFYLQPRVTFQKAFFLVYILFYFYFYVSISVNRILFQRLKNHQTTTEWIQKCAFKKSTEYFIEESILMILTIWTLHNQKLL